jgi:hypothetical protein
MKFKHILRGIIKSIPGIEHFYDFHSNTGGSNSARYCYSVWLRHLIHMYESGMLSLPEKIAELGPGDSLGIGLSALISGSERYFAFDIIKYTNSEVNLKIFDELVILFKNKTPIPDEKEFPLMKPKLQSYDFPDYIFTDNHLTAMLDEARLNRIRTSIKALDMPGDAIKDENLMIVYKAPWNDAVINESEEVDIIISQAVLQHIDKIASAYQLMYKWLKPAGLMSHVIDFKSMGSSEKWYGHWSYSDLEWKIVRGRKAYLINRLPYSAHINLLDGNGFKVIRSRKTISESIVDRKDLAPRFRSLSDEDISVSGAYILSAKKIISLTWLLFSGMEEYLLVAR